MESFVDIANREIFTEQIAKRRKGERSIYELDWITKEGGTISALVSGTPLFDGDQREFQGSFAIITDITERKLTDEALRESERKYREIFDNVSDSLFVFDVTSDRHFRFTGINATAEKLGG